MKPSSPLASAVFCLVVACSVAAQPVLQWVLTTYSERGRPVFHGRFESYDLCEERRLGMSETLDSGAKLAFDDLLRARANADRAAAELLSELQRSNERRPPAVQDLLRGLTPPAVQPSNSERTRRSGGGDGLEEASRLARAEQIYAAAESAARSFRESSICDQR